MQEYITLSHYGSFPHLLQFSIAVKQTTTNKQKVRGLNFTYILIWHLAVHSDWSRAASLNILSKHVALYTLGCQFLFRCTRITLAAVPFEYVVFDNISIVSPIAQVSLQSLFPFACAQYVSSVSNVSNVSK
jgi:hypothetical protein